jgi:hypothetical protein
MQWLQRQKALPPPAPAPRVRAGACCACGGAGGTHQVALHDAEEGNRPELVGPQPRGGVLRLRPKARAHHQLPNSLHRRRGGQGVSARRVGVRRWARKEESFRAQREGEEGAFGRSKGGRGRGHRGERLCSGVATRRRGRAGSPREPGVPHGAAVRDGEQQDAPARRDGERGSVHARHGRDRRPHLDLSGERNCGPRAVPRGHVEGRHHAHCLSRRPARARRPLRSASAARISDLARGRLGGRTSPVASSRRDAAKTHAAHAARGARGALAPAGGNGAGAASAVQRCRGSSCIRQSS